MNRYVNCNKEELLDIIQKLEEKTEKLSARLLEIQPSSTSHDTVLQQNTTAFKEKCGSKILEALPDMLSVLSKEGKYIDLISSEKTVRIGGSSANLRDKNIQEFLPFQIYQQIKANLDNVFQTNRGSIAHHDLEIENSLHHVENRIYPLDSDHALWICRDITDAVKAKQSLELANRKMLLAEKMVSLGQWTFNSKTQEFHTSDIIYDILEKHDTQTLLLDNYLNLIHPDDRTKIKNYLLNPRIHEDNKEHRLVINGKIKYLHTKISNIVKKDGDTVIEGYMQEVTDIIDKRNQLSRMTNRQLEQQNKIKELNSIMQTILNNVPVYLFVKDTGNEFRYLYWNKAFESFSHIPASRTIGRTDFEIFPNPKDAQKFREDDVRLLQNKERVEFQESYQAATGEIRIVNTTKTLVSSNDNKAPLLIGVSWDITDLKKTEQELIDARKKAEQSDKLKSAFLANMSHEIRTPLNAIVGFSKLIAESEDKEECQQYVDIVDNNANLLLQLINDILDLSKIEAGTLEFTHKIVNLKELCKNTNDIHQPRNPKNVKLTFDNNSPEISTISDSNRLSQVLSNLITNAQKFTKEGEIRFGYTLSAYDIEFYVSDNGIGIAKDKVDSIFNRFTKLNNFVQGTGLGLAICKMIIENLGGHIWVESTENVGSTFRFTIPKQEACELNIDSQYINSSISKKIMDTKKRILIAEDVDSNFLLLNALIGKTYTLIRANNGKEAVDLFKTSAPDLILMDIKMPEMNGLEATKIIRQSSTEIPIIALTAFAFDSDKQEALAAGCNDFMTKPLSPTVLRQTLEKYI